MKCIHCDNNLPENSAICDFCGKNPTAPTGYIRDDSSGLYFLTVDGADPQTGRHVMVVTYYDPVSGQYSQETRSVPDGFWYHAESGLYRLIADGKDQQTGLPIKLVTWFDLKTGRYSQEIRPVETTQSETTDIAQAEDRTDTGVEPNPETVTTEYTESTEITEVTDARSDTEPQPEKAAVATAIVATNIESDAQPEMPPESAIIAAHEEEFAHQEEFTPPLRDLPPEQLSPKSKKKRGRLVAALVILLILAGLGTAGYYLGYYDNLVSVINEPEIENIITAPEGAVLPAFSPEEQVETVSGVVASVEEDAQEPEEPQVPETPETPLPPVSMVNYYPQFAHVSSFYSRAAQDENYIYYLPAGNIGIFTETKDLMRVQADAGRPEAVANLWPGTNSVYSFALYEDNIFVCAYRPESDGYGFYSAPKAGGEPYLLLEADSPALINVCDGKIYMFFSDDQQLAVFGPDNGLTYLDMSIDTSLKGYAKYLPEFSVFGGYIYYAVAYQNGQNVQYERRLLDGAEKMAAFSPGSDTWTENPVWDADGNVYYGQRNFVGNAYAFKLYKPGISQQEIFSFAMGQGLPPILAGAESGGFVVQQSPDKLCKYKPGETGELLSVELHGKPYAATRDYLVAGDGLYRISDLMWVPFGAK